MRKIGKSVCEMPPAKNNPRNSEGAFIDLKDGRIMFAYSHYYADSNDDGAPAGIGRCFSSDKGETWSERELFILPTDHGADNIMSVSMLRMQNGDIGLFYCVKMGLITDCRLHLRRSADEGKTWGEPVCCIDIPGYFVTNNDRVIRLSSGRLFFAASKHNIREKPGSNEKIFDDKSSVYFFYSDDDGYTWHEAETIVSLNSSITETGMQEPGIIELKNGVLWSWSRTDMGRQYQTYSINEGLTWTPSEPSVFTATCSPLSMKRIPSSGHLLAVWNPIPIYQTRKTIAASWSRTPLVGAVSKDEGKTWDNYFCIDDDEDTGYCYTAIHFVDDALLLAYCAGSSKDGRSHLVRLRIKKINLSDIMDYKDESDGVDYYFKK